MPAELERTVAPSIYTNSYRLNLHGSRDDTTPRRSSSSHVIFKHNELISPPYQPMYVSLTIPKALAAQSLNKFSGIFLQNHVGLCYNLLNIATGIAYANDLPEKIEYLWM